MICVKPRKSNVAGFPLPFPLTYPAAKNEIFNTSEVRLHVKSHQDEPVDVLKDA